MSAGDLLLVCAHEKGLEISCSVPPEVPDAVIDVDSVLSRVDGDHSLLAEIIGIFLKDRDRLLSELRAAVSCADAAGIERIAHRLKGALGTLAARAASEAAGRLEKIGREGPLDQAQEILSILEKELERLYPELTVLARGAVLR